MMLRSQLILGAAVIATALSLWFPRWHYSDVSEEGAFALWGFPAPMVRSGLFYANYFGQEHPKNWLERKHYMYQHTSPADQARVYPAGMLTNFGTYAGFNTGVAMVIGLKARSHPKSASED